MRKVNWQFVGHALVRALAYGAILAFCVVAWLAIISLF